MSLLHLSFCLFPKISYSGCIPLLTEPALCRGDSVCLIGLTRGLEAISRKSFVTNPRGVLRGSSTDGPRYRAMNMEVIELDNGEGVSAV